jgi:hypothetical protein
VQVNCDEDMHNLILRYILNMVNSLLYFFTNYFKNRLLYNNLTNIYVREENLEILLVL